MTFYDVAFWKNLQLLFVISSDLVIIDASRSYLVITDVIVICLAFSWIYVCHLLTL